MAEQKNILSEIKDGILYLTINRESKLNALSYKILEELNNIFNEVNDNKSIRGVIITGAGDKAFVAGADINEISELNEVNARKFAEFGQEVFQNIESCHKPVIAVINGYALGGGCELAIACHMRVATENAKMGQPEVNLGIIPGYGGTQRLTHLIGRTKATEMLMTADMIDAPEAMRLGMLNYMEPTKELALARAEAILSKIMKKAPLSIGMIIDCVNAVYDSAGNGYQIEANSFARCVKSEDYREGTKAFLEKREPNFKGE
ncbi:MAG: enoyl-CoA hydratase/isomerase family protein [Lunatimonas sp.]|uniref:enoyl-CoA hydratase/isomerase family protein n=1 Tax=Lunatimonas sp. TaxID=2060141 RepID=UPI00263B1A4F|nr:enoyl-CoA hydratase-related protein [Lunatimonas sp.]MCC5938720.1 enoyl-CoA hydratase/isomerase family protein [Lunatimonas sp.]